MTTTITRPASPPTAPPALDLDARLALTNATMTLRLDQAAVAFEVNTAHIEAAPVDLADLVPLTPTIAPAPALTPIAACLQQARVRMETGGWCTGALSDADARSCALGAIRHATYAVLGSEATHNDRRSLETGAATLLLTVIQRRFPDAETIASWNDAQSSASPVIRALSEATEVANARDV